MNYTIAYNANGGSGTMDSQTGAYTGSTTLTSNAFTRNGYVFAGWATSADGNVAFSNGQSVTKDQTGAEPNSTVTLYAK